MINLLVENGKCGLENGVDINQKDDQGFTALQCFAQYGLNDALFLSVETKKNEF